MAVGLIFVYDQIIMNSLVGSLENEEDQTRTLIELNNKEDLFDVFIRYVLDRAPSIYVFINLTLLIWIGQTIFNSELSAIPHSLYLIAPFFTASPFSKLIVHPPNSNCPADTSPLSLKTFPTIYLNHITNRKIYNWGDPGFQICHQRLSKDNQTTQCSSNKTLCSGYCVNSLSQCPITGIKISKNPFLDKGYEQFYKQNEEYYQFTRSEGTPIVGMLASYQSKCSNDEHYYEAFQTEQIFWNSVKDCKDEGTIKSFMNQIDSMDTNAFFANNNISLTVTDEHLEFVQLNTVSQFLISNNEKEGCIDASIQAENIQSYLQRSPMTPQFTQSLLIISFILLVAQLLWLSAYYCFIGLRIQKNMIVVMLSVIELVVIGFIYNQNLQLFRVQGLTSTLAKCLKQALPAIKEWHFGIESPQVFQMVLFINTIFLSLYILALIINRFAFETYKRAETTYRFQSDQIDQLLL